MKPRVFVTHGGQNSFMESMFVGTPLVVCPGFADQPANGAKAQAMKVGLCVDRPVGFWLGELHDHMGHLPEASRPEI